MKKDATASFKSQDRLKAIMGGKSKDAEGAGYETGTSIFDPVLTELTYDWFCPRGGVVLDPFAGGSVRGIVASKLGLRYVGIDLSERQIVANREQAAAICDDADAMPDWRVGDSREAGTLASDVDADLVFSCPPYGSLERYTDDPRDLSTMSYDEFLRGLSSSVVEALSRLRQDRFAVFVVGDFRDSEGFLNRFPSRVIQIFEHAGARLYNEACLVTAVGSLPVRTKRMFEASRKLGRTHQNWLCFVKGSWKRATEACGALGEKNSSVNNEVDVNLYGSGLFGDNSWAPRRQGNLSERFKIPPFSVLSARDDWWQSRKRAWVSLGIKSELGRGGDGSRDLASPGGSLMPAADYSKRERVNSSGKRILGTSAGGHKDAGLLGLGGAPERQRKYKMSAAGKSK